LKSVPFKLTSRSGVGYVGVVKIKKDKNQNVTMVSILFKLNTK